MIVKMMSGQNLPDSDPKKRFSLIEGVVQAQISVSRTDFQKGQVLRTDCQNKGEDSAEPRASLQIDLRGGERDFRPIEGNVYLLNDEGSTIDCISEMQARETLRERGYLYRGDVAMGQAKQDHEQPASPHIGPDDNERSDWDSAQAD